MGVSFGHRGEGRQVESQHLPSDTRQYLVILSCAVRDDHCEAKDGADAEKPVQLSSHAEWVPVKPPAPSGHTAKCFLQSQT